MSTNNIRQPMSISPELKTTVISILKNVSDEKSAFRHFYGYIYDEWIIELFKNVFGDRSDSIAPILMREDGEDYNVTFVVLNTDDLETLYILEYKNVTNHTSKSLKKIIATDVKNFSTDLINYDKSGYYYEYLSEFWNKNCGGEPIDVDVLFGEIIAFKEEVTKPHRAD